jgi:hypothetical protein
VVEETVPLDEEEMEEAMSQAPKKDKDGSVAVGPWRPPWQNKASAKEAREALSRMPVVEIKAAPDEEPPIEIKIKKISVDGKV